MNKLRWQLGAGIGAVAVLAAARSLYSYASHGLWLGALTILALAAIVVLAMQSLWRARLRLEQERIALAATPPGGALLESRRAQLEALKTAGHTPNLALLAEATASEERGHAYLGRYFVTVTVLIGLVGTFAGLIETLRAMAPLLSDQTLSAAELVRGPLAGLDVTFGASIVAILVTLALSLVHGDVVLAEEAVLARLEERTEHWLVPGLWPRAERIEERQLQETVALRESLATLSATLPASLERTLTRVVESVSRSLETATDSQRRAMQASGEALAGEHRALTTALAALPRVVSEQLGQLAARVSASVQTSSAEASVTLRACTEGLIAEQRSALLTLLGEAKLELQDASAALKTITTGSAKTNTEAHRAITAAVQSHVAALEQAQAVLVSTMAGALESSGAKIDDAAAALRDGAGELGDTMRALTPALGRLSPELAALAREVALLASRESARDEADLVLDELGRVGQGVEQLKALLAMAGEGRA